MNRPPTGLRNGDRIVVTATYHPDALVGSLVGTLVGTLVVTATYVGWAGGDYALVRLDGTLAVVNVPRTWIRRPAADSAP